MKRATRRAAAIGRRALSWWTECPLLGGYGGSDAFCPDRRNWERYRSILSGDLAGDDGGGFAGCEENSYHVLVGTDIGASCVLDGFTVRGGNGNGNPAVLQTVGAGVFLQEASPTLANLTFTENQAQAGGAVCNAYESSPTVSSCAFQFNLAQAGAGMYCFGGANAVVEGCSFTGNTAESAGGAVYLSYECCPGLP